MGRSKSEKFRESLQRFWNRYWEVFLAIAVGVVLGKYVIPRFFK